MTPERYQKISKLLAAALELEPDRRAAFLDAACADDQNLRSEVESLIASDDAAGSFIASPAIEIAAGLIEQSQTQRQVPKRIGHYEIISLLGAGGMGMVYLAQDTKLDRRVAIKFLASDSIDAQPNRRLVREARAAAKLDHPNICSIHEVGEEDSRTYIVMQYVEGETLASRTVREPMTLSAWIDFAVNVADALSEAHSRGIIHRDIKPQNIMFTSRGQAKVMDFGLAQVVSQPALNESEVETKSLLTERGVVGTVPYMSPEQINGQPVDARSDIFSFGAVLYEALTGERAFKGSSSITILAAVLEHDPKPIPSRIPDRVANTILRCLRKDPSERYQTMTELKAALEELRGAPHSAVQVSSWVRRWGWAAITAILLLGGIVGLVVWQPWRTTKSGEPLQAEALTTLPGVERSPSLNPEGTHVTFGWAEPKKNQDIYVQLIGQDRPLQLTTDPRDDYEPVWSPDGKWICFFRSEPPAPTGLRSRELRIIPPLGGTERKLADIRSQDFYPHVEYLAWSHDSNSLVVTDSTGEGKPNALFVISLETGEKRQLTNPQSPVIADTSPAVSPDGRSLIFLRRTPRWSGELQLLQLGSGLTAAGEPRRLTDVSMRADFPAWMPDGNEIIFSSKGSLWRLNVKADDVPARIPYVGDDGFMPVLSRSSKGEVRLVYVRSSWDGNFWRIDTSAPGASATSKPVLAISSTKAEYHCVFSPDGSRVAFTSTRSGDAEIWVSDPDGSNAQKLTSLHAQDSNCPYWSPDGQWITFSSNGEGEFDVYVVSATGGKPRRLTTHPSIDIAPKFSRDGRWIYFSSMRTGDYRVWKMPAAGGDAIQVTPNHGAGGAVESPDGSNIYYHISSVESPLWRLSTSGGQPTKVLDRIVWFNWWLFGNGLYYIDQLKEETRLQYLNFATGKSTIIATNLGPVSAGLTVSPDGKTILYTREDSLVDDLMLVKNFH